MRMITIHGDKASMKVAYTGDYFCFTAQSDDEQIFVKAFNLITKKSQDIELREHRMEKVQLDAIEPKQLLKMGWLRVVEPEGMAGLCNQL